MTWEVERISKSMAWCVAVSLGAAGGAWAQSGSAPAAKPAAQGGQVYRCGNQYVDRPCNEKGGREVKITANVMASSLSKGSMTNPRARPPTAECVGMNSQADAMQARTRGQSSNEDLAQLRAKIESSGC
jgi:hypothetical protein